MVKLKLQVKMFSLLIVVMIVW